MSKSNRKRALFSLYDQSHAVSYARQLVNLGWAVVATAETEKLLKEHDVPVEGVPTFLGVKESYPFPPTLHPAMELALTSAQGVSIDLVYDTTYPLSQGNDVGGHTLLALAAKGERIVVCDGNDMQRVIDVLRENHNQIDSFLRTSLIDKAHTKISSHYARLIKDPAAAEACQLRQLKEGENPYQTPAYFFHRDSGDPLALGNFMQVSGAAPCFTNMADFDSLVQVFSALTRAFDALYGKTPHVVIAAKHGNPCGLAVDWESVEAAIDKALWAHPAAIWGGELITNGAITETLARRLFASSERGRLFNSHQWMLDLIVAPHFSGEAVAILGKRQERKLFQNEALGRACLPRGVTVERMVRGGFLRQPPPDYVVNLESCDIDFPFPGQAETDSLVIAWAASWFSNHGGNEVALAKERRLLAAGGGPATVDACRTAVARAKACGHDTTHSVFGADAFFPFTDGPEELMRAGCAYGVVPDGGKNSALVKDCFKSKQVGVFFLPEQFRGFCRH